MSGYVLKRNTDSRNPGELYVAPLGRPAAYTNKLQHARVFTTLAEAEREKCGNETILPLDEAMLERPR